VRSLVGAPSAWPRAGAFGSNTQPPGRKVGHPGRGRRRHGRRRRHRLHRRRSARLAHHRTPGRSPCA